MKRWMTNNAVLNALSVVFGVGSFAVSLLKSEAEINEAAKRAAQILKHVPKK